MGIAGHHVPVWYDEATGPANGQGVFWNAATQRWEPADVDTSALDTAGLATDAELAAGLATKQPVDSDLTAIAALSTTSFGRGLLALADGAALAGSIPSGTYAGTKTPGVAMTAVDVADAVPAVPALLLAANSAAANGALLTAAVSRAKAAGTPVGLPAGTFDTNYTPIIDWDNGGLVSAGTTILHMTADQHGVEIRAGAAFLKNWILQGIKFKGPGAGSSTKSGIYHYNEPTYVSNRGRIVRCSVEDFNKSATLNRGDSWTAELHINNCTTGIDISGNANGCDLTYTGGTGMAGPHVTVADGNIVIHPEDVSGIGLTAGQVAIDINGGVVEIIGGNFESCNGDAFVDIATNAKVHMAGAKFLKGTGGEKPPITIANGRLTHDNLQVSGYAATTPCIRKTAIGSIVTTGSFPSTATNATEIMVDDFSTGAQTVIYPATPFPTRVDNIIPAAAAPLRGQFIQAMGRDASNTRDGLYYYVQDKSTGSAAFRRCSLHTGMSGTGNPEGVVTANIGTAYLREDGGTGTTLYLKESGTGNTGWRAVASVAPDPSGTDIRSLPDSYRPTGVLVESYSRVLPSSNQAILSSGRLGLCGMQIGAGVVISTISFCVHTTAAVAPTAQWFALFDGATTPAKLAVTADDGATAWGTVEKKLYISRSVTDAAITSGTATLTSATAAFTSTDVGKQVTVMGAGAAGVPLGTSAARVTVLSVESGTSCTLSANAGTTVSGATAYVATPYTTLAAGLFYVGLCVVAGTVPTMVGMFGVSATATAAPILHGGSTTGLTTPSTCPNPAATPNTGTQMRPYCYVA